MFKKISSWFYSYDKYKLNYKRFDFLIIGIICILCIGFTERTFQNDTFYSIPIGRDILKYGVDMIDHYSIHNIAYTYPHWLFDVIVYLLYSLGGFKILYFFSIFMYIIIGLLLYFLSVNLFKNRFVSSLFSISTIICLSWFITIRAQIFSYILFILELFFIEKFLATSNKKYLIVFPILSIFIINMHCAVWIFFFILFLPYIFEYLFGIFNVKNLIIFKYFFNRKIDVVINHDVKYLICIMLLCIITGFITLNGFTPFTYLFKTIKGGSINWISEHQAPKLFHCPNLLFYVYLLFFVFVFIKQKIKLSDFFLCFGLLILAFFSFRHISLLLICSCFSLTRYISNYFGNNYGSLSNIFIKFLSVKFYYVFVIAIIFSSSVFYFCNIYKHKFVDVSQYPVSASNYIIKNLDYQNIRIFNDYDYGSYLLFRGIPVFIDSRADLYTPQFNGLNRDITKDYLEVVLNYEEVFDYYDITHVIVYKCDSKTSCNGLYYLLYSNEQYDVIYEDKYFAFFEREIINE